MEFIFYYPSLLSYTTHPLRRLASGPLAVIILNDINIYINEFSNPLASFPLISSLPVILSLTPPQPLTPVVFP